MCGTAQDEIPKNALHQIYSADIVIGLIAAPNPNVIYEVAYRQTLHRKLILVVGDPDDLPLYIKSLAYHNWKQDDVLKRIETIAGDSVPDLPDFTAKIPDTLKETINASDSTLQAGLLNALKVVESENPTAPSNAAQSLLGIVSEDTGNFYPTSVIEFEFSSRNEYANPVNLGIVRSFDTGFVTLYNYVSKAEAEHDSPLTLDKLVK